MRKTAAVNGVTLSYSEVGTGTPLLCLHGGMGLDARTLQAPGILDLAGHGVRLLLPDQRGHGRSSRCSPADYTHATWVADVHALAGAIGLSRFALLGHSYGGFLALEYAVCWPGTLTHLVLVATSAGPVSVSSMPFATDAQLREHFRRLWPQFFVGDHKHWALLEEAECSAEAYNAAFTRELLTYDVRERVPHLQVPVLLVVGSRDWYLEPMQWLARHTPNARLCVLEEAGHFPFVEAAGPFTAAVAAFLTGGM